MRDFKSNKGTIKQKKDMKGKICLQPFTNVDIGSNYEVRVCSESWMPTGIGDFQKNSIKEIWNSDIVKKVRKSILDGTYEFCDWHQCIFYCNDAHYLYSIDQLDQEKLAIYKPWIEYIKKGKVEIDLMPANYNLAYDETCNLKCPSCRNEPEVYTKGPEYEKRMVIHNKLMSEIDLYGFNNIGRLNLSGSGEPFLSKIYSDFLFNFDGTQYPKLNINLQTNGLLLTPENWKKMEKIQNNINEIIISLDASTEETYKTIRVNGDYKKLLSNIEFMAQLRQENKVKRLMLAFVVQKKNYKEMVDAVRYAKKLKIDLFIFNLLNDWLSWSEEEYNANAVWKDFHPEFNDFLKVLKDPVFEEPFVDLANMIEYHRIAKLKY